jgi:uncharacterized membrane protein YccC
MRYEFIDACVAQQRAIDAQQEGPMGLMNRLQNLTITRLELDEAVELSMFAEGLRESYKKHQVSSPEWLDDAIRTLDRYIGDQTRDRMEMELRELAQADAADRTSAERRDDRKRRREELEAKLGKTVSA